MIELFGHPFSSYTWKALIALYENDTPFTFRTIGPDQPENGAALARAWPIAKFPVLLDDGAPVIESSIIIEHLQLRHPGPVRLIPADPVAALAVRALDRIFDHHVMDPMSAVVAEHIPFLNATPDPARIARGKAALATIYGWLETHLQGREWAAGGFSLADCAAAPALFYADWVLAIPEDRPLLRGYRARLLARPSVARCVDEARPFRAYFPLGAPDRD